MRSLDDTIVALSTPAGPSAEAILRLSGPEAFLILGQLLAPGQSASGIRNPKSEIRNPLCALPPYSVLDTQLRLRPDGPPIPATLYLMRAPRSYTRQDVAEVHTLGSTPLLRMLLDACIARGARVAEPGEFTRRAFLAGRIDLAQAEAVLAVIQATTAAEHRAATRALQGLASRHIRELHDALVGLRAQVEAAIDFAEHDIELVSRDELLAAIGATLQTVEGDLRTADAGALPPEGIRVALCGLPNAGKSSLFNALLARQRAIVTPIPGTTRDAVAEPLVIEGISFRLCDTAGLPPADGLPIADCQSPISEIANRESQIAGPTLTDPIDAEAIARSRGLIAGTHIALVVLDASQPLGEAERRLWAEVAAPHKLLILSKSDLPSAIAEPEAAALAVSDSRFQIPDSKRESPIPNPQSQFFRVSALTGEGLDALRHALAELVRSGRVEASPSDLLWNARHREALVRAREALERARAAAAAGLGEEFIAADLRDAHDALGTITGQVAPDHLLDLIFARFCIGK